MAGRTPNTTVCGIPTHLGGPIHYGGGHITVGVGKLGHYRSISKPGAKRLLKSLFGHERTPRPGYEIKLCGDQYLENMSGSFQIRKRVPGDISGAKREPPPIYHPRQGPPPGVPVLKGRRTRKRRR
jgi:hypothetical protein